MSTKNKVILYSIILTAIFYLLDTIVYYQVFAEESSFMQVFITAVPLTEVYNRMILILGILTLGFISSGLINQSYKGKETFKGAETDHSSGMDSAFISGLSYQIRTPLNAIVGFSELLKDPNLSIQSKTTYVNHIHSSGNYLLQLITNLSDISKIESNQMSISKSDTRLNQMMDELKGWFEERKKEIGRSLIELKLIKASNDSELTINTDPNRLKQVLTNLIESAIKHTDEGYVEFGYRYKNPDLMEFFVNDTGRGFSKDRLEMIFDRYNRLTDHQNQPFDTVALQLTISKSLVKLLGGGIHAESEIGRGSSIYFTLPLLDADEENREPVDEGIPEYDITDHYDWNDKVILIAEDVESNFIYLQELLRPTKAVLLWAKNGKEALSFAQSHPKIDLVLMDVLMPEMDGYEATREIKSIFPTLPVIAQTAYGLEGGDQKEDITKFDDFLIKPIWSPKLMNMINNYLG